MVGHCNACGPEVPLIKKAAGKIGGAATGLLVAAVTKNPLALIAAPIVGALLGHYLIDEWVCARCQGPVHGVHA